jgi:predicted NUDIX family NTP pyrophosphohydrolase
MGQAYRALVKRSAGLLPFRRAERLEVLIAHPGGPFFARRDAGAWSIVKGELEDDEAPLQGALREFGEETGWPVPRGPFFELGEVRQRNGKVVLAWGVETDHDPQSLAPGTFEMSWRGRMQSFPEIDRVVWADPAEASRLLNPAQVPFLARLDERLAGR